jgi:hypothetical protein
VYNTHYKYFKKANPKKFAFLFLCSTFVLLKKLISICLLFVLLINNTEFHQMMKLPILVKHFIHHKSLDNSLSFTEFIEIHYNDSQESNDQSHDNLPFKSHECKHMTSMVLVCDFPSNTAFKTPSIVLSPASYQEAFYTSGSVGSIWQPPQFI